MIHGEQAGREVLGVGVDRVAEQKQLHHRQRDNESQCYRVAQYLQPLLAQERDESFEGECPHDSSPFTPSMWMKTSSRRGSTSCHKRAPLMPDRMAFSSAAPSVPAMRKACPNTAAASTPGAGRSCRAAASRSSPVASNV